MNMFQLLFTKFADILLSSRTFPFLQCQPSIQNQTKEMGVIWTKEMNLNVRQLLQNNWRTSQSNEMIVQFFIENDGNSFLVEEWCLIQQQSTIPNQLTSNKKNNTLLKQLTIWLRSAIAMMTMTTIFKEEFITKQYKVSHSLLFYNKNTKKRSDWIDDSKLQVKKITTKFLNQQNLQLTIAQQGSLDQVLLKRMNRTESPLYKRCRYLSEQICDKDSQAYQRKMTMDSEQWDQQKSHIIENTSPSSTNNLNRSFISVYSRKEEVELLFTQEEAALKLQDKNFLDENYEINMMTNDHVQKEIFISQIMITNKLSIQEKNNQQQILNTLKNIHNKSKNRRIRSLQITKLLNFYRQFS
ncbi:unnamed protein product [Paramecium pentaurelia]|uniref:Uncharacterized protein n=1 Tax=Paramecium pentaurelia TaxID=43138 RepID=A0A8S1UKW3_9CILI|nr:unnamed protein product [Paramecium pentaurelia]